MFFNKNEITLEFITTEAGILKNAPIREAKHNMPKWYKDLPPLNAGSILKQEETSVNMRSCTGFSDYYNRLLEIPLWSDVNIAVAEIGAEGYAYNFANVYDGKSAIASHHKDQRGDLFNDNDFCHLKFETPWIVRSSEPVDLLFLDPLYNSSTVGKVFYPQGIIKTNETPNLHVNVFVRKEQDKTEFTLQYDAPLVHLLPLTDKKIKIVNRLVTDQEFKNIKDSTFSVTSFVGSLIKQRKKQKQCPFNFRK